MKNTRPALSLILLLAMLFSMVFTACAPDTQQETSEVQPTEEAAVQPQEEYTEPLQDGYNQITFYWTYSGTYENCDMWIWWGDAAGKGYLFHECEYGAKIEVTGKKADLLREKNVKAGEIVLGVRPEHVTLTDKDDPAAIPCKIMVNEMMGSELHLHVVEENGDQLIVRIPTVSLDDEQRKAMVYGSTIYITFEGKVMHFFDPESETNLLV